MYSKVLNFIKYNNAFTILLALFFFGFGISFAAEPAVRESIYSSEQTVISVDNGTIVSADLDSYNFNLRINSITDDEKNYYAAYSYQTMEIVDSVWQNKQIEKTLTISKEALDGKDLGLYVAKELGENINYELSYLKKVQKLEQEKGESQKVITTEYSGLIGKLLDPKQEVIEGYEPVIPEPIPEAPVIVEENPEDVIVSTQYPEPQAEPEPVPQEQPAPDNSPAEPSSDEEVKPEGESPEEEDVDPSPAPTEMINEELVQEVVEVLLQSQTEETADPAPSTDSPATEDVSNSDPETQESPEPSVNEDPVVPTSDVDPEPAP
ncbi:MAG: hypothetical protein M0P76_00605 [Candidatus Pacebacteria bacterium]|jgi:hypothetical protein|nr:hypothetical protein [Candidatus Paceibacterota bacterium]